MKTIFITIFDAAITKNILRTDVFRLLKEKVKIVLLVNKSKKEYYRSCFEEKNVIVETFPQNNFLKRIENRFFRLGFISVHTNTVQMRIKEDWRKNHSYFRYFSEKTLWFLGAYKFWRELFRSFHFLIPSHVFQNLFEKYQPDLVFASDMISAEDMTILREAKKQHILTLGMVKSWDSLTATTFILEKPDFLIVHNSRVKKDAISLADYPENKIFISGIPQWDIYFDKSVILEKKEFFKEIKADPKKKLILYCGAGFYFFPKNWKY